MDLRGADGKQALDSGEEMTCQELVELVTVYREGLLSARDHERFEAHLLVCPPCVNYVEQMDSTVRALGTLDKEQLARVEQESATQELLRLFRSWKSERQS